MAVPFAFLLAMDESSGCSTSLPAFGVVSILFLKFIYVEREGERERVSEHVQGRGRERRRDRIPGRLYTVSTEPDMELKLPNSKIMT